MYGVDISKHQKDNTVKEIAENGKAKFVIMRATVGTYTVDEKLKQFYNDVIYEKIPFGFYHAAYAGTVEEALCEADFLINTIKELGVTNTSLPIFYDYEYFSADYNKARGIITTPKLVRELTKAFCDRIKSYGLKAGLYSNFDYINRFYGEEFLRENADYYFWYARPGLKQPDRACYLWQYAAEDGDDFGYTGGAIDKNILYGEFLADIVIPKKPLSKNPVPLKIGYASSGDIKALVDKINHLGIQTNSEDGYIYTKDVSSGDQSYILTDCSTLNIPCKIYKAPVEKPQDKCEKCRSELLIEIKKLLKMKG